jgi:SAM-dependent methyltransferase
MTTIAELDARYFPDFVDEHERFHRAVRRYLLPGYAILDAGAGDGRAFTHDYGRTGLVVGADRESEVARNPNLDLACRCDLAHLPFGDGSFDLVLAKYVFEHLSRPLQILREIRRVLKPGRVLVFHTPNRFHYVAIAAALTPTRFHGWYNRRRTGAGAHAHATYYRANDRRTIARLASESGFRVAELELFEPKPAYLFFDPLAYRAGIGYQRLVTRSERLRDLRANVLGVLQAV